MLKWVKWSVFSVVVAGILGLVGCSSGVSPFGIDESSEIQIGQQAAADIERQYGVVNDATQVTRVQRIGRSIAAVSNRPNLPWSFKILNTTEVNAVSLPGGPVYVTKGLLATGLSDAELSGVLGHEIAHTNQRHAVKAMQKAMTYELISAVALGNSSAAVQQAANIAIQVALELPNSRSDEYEADSIGIRLAYNAGYPANGLVQFLQRLASISGSSRTPSWLSTHPLTSDRIARAQQIATQVSSSQRPVPISMSQKETDAWQKLQQDEKQDAGKVMPSAVPEASSPVPQAEPATAQ